VNKTLKKAAMYTDIHFGAKQNSEQHNKDCIEYLTWFCNHVKNDPSIDHIIFMGDYFEHRAAISGLTLNYAYFGAKAVNDLGLPVFVIAGNHDLFYRTNREVHNTNLFESLSNFTIVSKITPFDYLGDRGAVLCPFLFEDEFPQLLDFIEYPVIFAHLEFKNFVITGDTIVKEHGPDHTAFKQFKKIFTGHFHKRQSKDNVHYIGNTFPTNFADVNDRERGFATYEYKTDKISYFDWLDSPTYIRCKLSTLMENPKALLKPKSTVQCLVDIDLTYEESLELRANLIAKYKLRELTLDEGYDLNKSVDGDSSVAEDMVDQSMDNLIVDKLKTVAVKGIDNEELIKIYKALVIK
jgi:DNA repair exonuclease SbcCD nuclease subunit